MGGSVSKNGYGLSYYQTHYGDATGPDGTSNSQVVGGVGVQLKDFSFRIENDFFAFKGEDRFRTNAVEISYGDFSIGTTLRTNDPKGSGGKPVPGTNLRGKKNRGRYQAWNNGVVYNTPLYFGYRSRK